jgi:hypothetical protein
MKARDLSTQLSQALSKTVDACEWFFLQDADYFRTSSASGDTYRPLNLLPFIQITFDDLLKMKQKLEFTTERSEQFAKDVSQKLSRILYIYITA